MSAQDLSQPPLTLRLDGEVGRRLDAVVDNWLLTAPDANPGMIEMFRLRDRKPPYEDPVPWAGEFIGKYLTSAVEARRMTDSPELDALLRRLIPELISTQADDGYLGPFQKDQRLLGQWDLWGHYHVMLALWLWYRDTGDQAALDAATRAADLVCATYLDTGKRVHDAGSHEMNMAILHSLGFIYRETGREPYLRMMRDILADWEKPPAGDYYRQALEGVDFYQTPKPRWESLHPIMGLAEMYRITGDDSYRQALLEIWRSIRRTDIHNAGSFSTGEGAVGNPFQSGSIETCCTVAWLALSVEALRLSADSRVADAIELATLNTVLGYEHPSGRWCTYDTPMDGKRAASAHTIVFQSRVGTPELNCCSVNGPRGLGLISEWGVLGDTTGLYLNYYGPGAITASIGDTAWRFQQETTYPADGKISITVDPGKATTLPLYLRIPEWSTETSAAVNGQPIAGAAPGTYLKIAREWKQGDVIELNLDMRLRAMRGDGNVEFKTSLFKGPLLLAFDQKHNQIEPADMPALDLDTLSLEPATCDAQFKPIVLFKAKATDGADVYLCDYATAGAHGTLYRSWLPVNNAPLVDFMLTSPEDNARIAPGGLSLEWQAAAPDATYTVVIAEDEKLERVTHSQSGVTATDILVDAKLEPGKTYYWQVLAEGASKAAVNGPRRFIIDPSLLAITRGVVLSAPLAGNAEPAEGALLQAVDVAPAPGRDGKEAGALYFNGKTSKLVYAAPGFPTRNYTFSAWIRPEGIAPNDKRWHHVVSAWYTGMNDGLRLSVVGGELSVCVEQPSGRHGTKGVAVKNDEWVHVAVVKKADKLRLYVNGEMKQEGSLPRVLASQPPNIGIGCNPNHTELENFQGAISNVEFRREALSDEEIKARYSK
ncbi:MAG TPA: beta-L-arabinofuranosidase domain-containing protein [Candidatus Bathyarchaeia archaeon]|nr:beta-L-arabinofuranosidase domain-containing protein [Candidatus Bathyarchaeia archaeon]